ncbi:FadR/GntR family transcriptional regulator [Piscinibacter sakaiensis]|uniref:FadR/GntR family transcriptional regulator n=1 Tax=Piscinibacter sakaiensis TaxID=1547922 RepID=UPI003AAA6298
MKMASTTRSPVAAAALSGSGFAAVPERLSDRLAARLIEQIERGALRPGDRLPTELQLAESHGVSRSVVREAVHRVKARGLLVARQGSGVYVSQPAAHQPLAFDPQVLESMTAVVQVVELRRVLEGEMAALAAERATRSQVAGLRRALKAIDTANDAGRDGLDEDMGLHRAIGAATGNPQFTRLLAFLEQYLREAMRVTKGNEARRADFMRQVREEHAALVEAIAARDPQAARQAAIAHLINGEWRLEEGGVIPRRRGAGRRAAKPPSPSRKGASR